MRHTRRYKKSPEKSFYLGVISQTRGQHKEAVAHYQKAINLGLKDVSLYSNYGLALFNVGQLEKAAATLRLALRIEPGFISALLNLGLVLQAMGQLNEPKALYRQVLAMRPDNIEALANLGEVLRIQGALDEAEECLNRGWTMQPNHVGLLLSLGAVLYAKFRIAEAEDYFKWILSTYPDNVIAQNNLGSTMYTQGRLDEAEACYKRALSIDPENAEALSNIGVLMLNRGNLVGAEENLKRAIAIKPNFAKAHLHLVNAKKITLGDNTLIAHMENMVGRSELGAEEKSDIHFALGKCYDDCGEYEQAFFHFENGHRLERLKYSFDPIRYVDEVSKLIAIFDKEFYSQRTTFGSHSEVPIFIVGMPRSGTTLVEQIISNHPTVFGAGELYFMDGRIKEISLESIKQLNRQQVQTLAYEYEVYLRSFSSSALHITDKMPQNFFHLGLIRLCFPRAHIIHCKRSPLDTCLSIYTQKFATDHPYAHELKNMALYYTQYKRLMQHWKEVLPGQLFEVQYEDLVTDQEMVTRELLEFCNIERNDMCLAFDRNERAVHTASCWQVRQPLYSSSIGRWKRYRSFLEPLMQLEQ